MRESGGTARSMDTRTRSTRFALCTGGRSPKGFKYASEPSKTKWDCCGGVFVLRGWMVS